MPISYKKIPYDMVGVNAEVLNFQTLISHVILTLHRNKLVDHETLVMRF